MNVLLPANSVRDTGFVVQHHVSQLIPLENLTGSRDEHGTVSSMLVASPVPLLVPFPSLRLRYCRLNAVLSSRM